MVNALILKDIEILNPISKLHYAYFMYQEYYEEADLKLQELIIENSNIEVDFFVRYLLVFEKQLIKINIINCIMHENYSLSQQQLDQQINKNQEEEQKENKSTINYKNEELNSRMPRLISLVKITLRLSELYLEIIPYRDQFLKNCEEFILNFNQWEKVYLNDFEQQIEEKQYHFQMLLFWINYGSRKISNTLQRSEQIQLQFQQNNVLEKQLLRKQNLLDNLSYQHGYDVQLETHFNLLNIDLDSEIVQKMIDNGAQGNLSDLNLIQKKMENEFLFWKFYKNKLQLGCTQKLKIINFYLRWNPIISKQKYVKNLKESSLFVVKEFFIYFFGYLVSCFIGSLCYTYRFIKYYNFQQKDVWKYYEKSKNFIFMTYLIWLLVNTLFIMSIYTGLIFEFDNFEIMVQNCSIYRLILFNLWGAIYYIQAVSTTTFQSVYIDCKQSQIENINELELNLSSFYLEFLTKEFDELISNMLPTFSKIEDAYMDEGVYKLKNQKRWINCLQLYQRIIFKTQKQIVIEKNIEKAIYIYQDKIQNNEPQLFQGLLWNLIIIGRFLLPSLPFILSISNNSFYMLKGCTFNQQNFILWFQLVLSIASTFFSNFNFLYLQYGQVRYGFQKQKVRTLSRISNLIRFTPNNEEFVPKEVPTINIYCLYSLESWYNLRKLASNQDRYLLSLHDLEISINTMIYLILLILIFLDFSKILGGQTYLITDYFILFPLAIDIAMSMFIQMQCLFIKAKINEFALQDINRLDQIKTLINEGCLKIRFSMAQNNINTNILGDNLTEMTAAALKQEAYLYYSVYQTKQENEGQINQIGNQLKILLNYLEKEIIEQNKQENLSFEIIKNYCDLLIEKLDTITKGIKLELTENPEKFLGLIYIDYKLINSAVFSLLILSLTSAIQFFSRIKD